MRTFPESKEEREENHGIPSMDDFQSCLSDTSERPDQSKTYKIAFWISFPVFCTYSSCISLQKHLSFVFGLSEGVTGTELSFTFGIGVSFVFVFNLIFRVFGHNIFFGCLRARDRVIASLLSGTLSMIILTILCLVNETPHVAWVFISYSLCGVLGSFAPNMLNVTSHLGETRYWVVLAIPSGIGFISLSAFAMVALGCPFWVFYIISGVLDVFALVTYLLTIYPESKRFDINQTEFGLRDFFRDLSEIKKWFPPIFWHSFVFILDMFCLAFFNPGVTLYEYDRRVTFRLLGGITIDHDWFIFIYNVGSFVGEFLSCKVMDERRLIHPIFFLFLLILGGFLNLCLIPEIAPLAGFMFMWANGGLVVQTTRYLNQKFPHQFHLTTTSMWLFLGDIGSTCGSNSIQPSRSFIDSFKSRMY